MAAGILKLLATERGLNVEVRSAGLAHHPDAPIAKNAIAAMREVGIDISGDYSKGLTSEALEWADVVLVVQRKLADHILEDHPEMKSKVHHLEEDVHDPYGGSIAEYRGTRIELHQLLESFLQSLRTDT